MKKKLLSLTMTILLVITLFTACGKSETATSNSVTKAEEVQLVACNYTDRDNAGTYDESKATKVNLSKTYTIKKEGVYIFTGTLKNGQIIVDTDDSSKVQIVLNGVNITSNEGSAIYIKKANKIFITLAEDSQNTLCDASAYSSTEDEPWGCIFSKSDLCINGKGALDVTGNYNNGIVSKDDLRITGGNITITAVNNGIKGRDSVGINGGTINVTATNDGIKSDNDEDKTKGFVSIDGGDIIISGTSSQGIQGESTVQLIDGTLSIDSNNEGIQGKVVYVSGTTSTIKAQDDGLNATDGSTSQGEMDAVQKSVSVQIVGGKTNIEAYGDGIDSNGDLYISGGETIVNGPTNGGNGSLDYNGVGQITGGTIITLGANGMAQNFDSSSTQFAIMYNSASGVSGTKVSISDSNGKKILETTAAVNFSSVILSSPDLKKGKTYTLTIGSTTETITLSDIITSVGDVPAGAPGSGSMMPGGNMGKAPDQ